MLRRVLPLALSLIACGGSERPPASPTGLDASVDTASSTDAVADVRPGDSGCPTCAEYSAREAFRVTADRLAELSGIVEGRAHAGIFYVHNDSGDRARFFAVDLTGAVVGEYRLSGVTAIDWEDVAAAPCALGRCLYFGDIGDNDRARSGYVIYRVREPDPVASTADVPSTALPFVYPDGAHNAETLLAEEATGDLFIVTKEESGASGVYRYPAAMQTGATATLERVAALNLPPSGAQLVTGGDLHPCGGRLLIRTYVRLFEYERPIGAPISQMFEVTPREVSFRPERQGEAVGWRADGRGYVTVSEGSNPTIYSFACATP